MTRPDFSSRGGPAGRRWGNAILGLGLVCALWSGWGAWKAWSARREIRASLERVRDTAATLDPRRTGSTGGELAAAAAQLDAAIAHPPAAVVSVLAAQLPADARYTSMTLRYDAGARLELSALARRPEAYDAMLEGLARLTEIEQVLPGGETRSDEVDGRVRASFKGSQ